MFQDGPVTSISSSYRQNEARSASRRARESITCKHATSLFRPSAASQTDENSSTTATHSRERIKTMAPDTACNRFPFSDFRHSLTLFSKFFASFPHGTCSLSVSRQYLALDGIYHPLQAAIPSSPTRQERIVRPSSATAQDSHLLRYPVPRDLSDGLGRWRLPRLQFRGPRGPPDLKRELCPLHSPLLRASWLVSFPPLSDMLKFSG